MTTNQNNILTVYSQATPAELEYGLKWYGLANREVRGLAREFGKSVSTVAGVVAALSPNQSWGNNLLAARRVLEGVRDGLSAADVKVPTYNANKLKAFAIANGGRVKSILRGPKVNAFYQNILHPTTSTEVTVDGHAYSIWNGKRHVLCSSDKQTEAGRIPKLQALNRYDDIGNDYRAVAASLGLQPWQVQAVTWVVWRRLYKVWTDKQDKRVMGVGVGVIAA